MGNGSTPFLIFFVQKMHKLLSSLKYQGKVLQEEFGKLLGGKRTSKATAHLEALEELLTAKNLFLHIAQKFASAGKCVNSN